MPTVTTNQLHFNDLDPIRFEELIMSMVYRAKKWIKIDHFGKKGSDDGIDIRAIDEQDDHSTRTHYYQCKRYEKISKSQLKSIVSDFSAKNEDLPNTYTLVLSCPLSKQNVEFFENEMHALGVPTVMIWTSSFLEARLYHEFHDLLFVYFGIDVLGKRRNRMKAVTRNLAMKKRMKRDFIDPEKSVSRTHEDIMKRLANPQMRFSMSNLLIRSIDDTAYPDNTLLDIDGTGYFKVEPFDFYHKGLIVMTHPGWVHIDIKEGYEDVDESTRNILAMTLGYIPYDNIVDYDMDGDEYYIYPHLFCDFVNVHDPFEKIGYAMKTDEGFRVLYDDSIVL